MTMFELKCPYCGADLEIKDDVDTFYCMHCGGKIMLDELDENATKLKLKKQEYDFERFKIEKEMEENERKRKDANRSTMILIAIVACCFLAILILGLTGVLD